MKFARFLHNGKSFYGIVDQKIYPIRGDIFGEFQISGEGYEPEKVKLLPPCQPSKIILVGLNYLDHVKESQSSSVIPEEPVLFMKPSTSIIGPEEVVFYPEGVERLDFEAELAVVIRDRCKNLTPSSVQEHILGFTCLNDVTARNLQKKDVQWTRAKSFDTFCPLGPFIVDKIDLGNLKIQSYLNGRLRQSSNTNQMIFSVERIVSLVSQVMTLLPGDVISTGTPAGVGPMKPGDTVEIFIENIGTLRNYVKKV
ncbi:MAG: fumarylacetoacetate hydrolase family protein [candidate division Zixibacteria bacterium]|nr:fumarylacetoacetate hydrolase family protein [candidate division Zixibacteria bacterium]